MKHKLKKELPASQKTKPWRNITKRGARPFLVCVPLHGKYTEEVGV